MDGFSNIGVEPPEQQPPIPVQTPVQKIFRSPAIGFCLLRVFIYLVLAYAFGPALRWAGKFWTVGEASPYSPKHLLIAELAALIAAFSAAWIMSKLEARPSGAYGLPRQGAFGKHFVRGVLFGLAEISAVIGPLAVLRFYHFGPLAIHGSQILRWALFWAFVFLLVGLYEEFAFRGYVQFTLAQGMGFWPAACLLSALFGLVHLGNPGETAVGIAGIVLTGLFWAFTLRRTGMLWFAVGMHASFDFGETFLYSVPDSGMIFPGHLSNATLAGPAWATGGSAGPEASLFDFVTLLVFFVVIDRMYPAIKPDSPEPTPSHTAEAPFT